MRTINLEDENLEARINLGLINMENVRSFKGRDVVRIGDFNRDEMMYVLEVARIFGDAMIKSQDDFTNFEYRDLLDGKNVTIGFKENSSRTRRSHSAAAQALGANVIIEEPNEDGTSSTKGECLAHDVATCSAYFSHLHVMRTKIEGAPQYLADYGTDLNAAHPKAVTDPVIFNGGDGAHEHPTQAFLDLLTLYHLFNVEMDGTKRNKHEPLDQEHTLSGLTMLAVGDTLKGRTFKSLARALGKFEDNEVVIVSPEEVRAPQAEIDDLRSRGLDVKVMDSLDEAIAYANTKNKSFMYGLRTQEERLDNKTFERVKDAIYVKPDLLEDYQSGVLPIMHPLPMNKKNPELSPEIDFLPNAEYFMQMRMGEFARMALMALTLGAVKTSADDRPYVDTRGRDDKPKFHELDLEDFKDESVIVMETMDKIVRKGDNLERIRDYLPRMDAVSEDPEALSALFMEMFGDITVDGKQMELPKHLTFRFGEEDSGFVIDKIDDGNTGIVKWMMDMTQCHNEMVDQYGRPLLLSAVDGLVGTESGPKGVVKMRGYTPEPEAFQLLYLLSKRTPVVTFIEKGKPVKKFTPTRPEVLDNVSYCKNPDCVTQPHHYQHARPVLYHKRGGKYECRHCDTKVQMDDLKLIKSPDFKVPRSA